MVARRHRWRPHMNWTVGGRGGFSARWTLAVQQGLLKLFCIILKNSVLTVGLHCYDMSFSLSLATNESGSPHIGLRMTLSATAGETQQGTGKSRNKGRWSPVCDFRAESGEEEKHRVDIGRGPGWSLAVPVLPSCHSSPRTVGWAKQQFQRCNLELKILHFLSSFSCFFKLRYPIMGFSPVPSMHVQALILTSDNLKEHFQLCQGSSIGHRKLI